MPRPRKPRLPIYQCRKLASSMEPNRPRRKYSPRLDRDQRRSQVLDAALTVLSTAGLHELNMEAVAAAADVAKAVVYTAFDTRTELVEALLQRELKQGLAELRNAMPDDLHDQEPTAAYAATISAFLQAVLENPSRWRLILTIPDSAPRDYRDSLRNARRVITDQAEELARAAADLTPRLAPLDPDLLGHAMLSFAEMLGRLAARDADTFPRERLENFANTLISLTVIGAGGAES